MDLLKDETKYWGSTDSQNVYLYKLSNANNVSIFITNFGATITAINVPDREGKLEDIALGYDDLRGYINDTHYMGGIVGRYANRINGGRVEIDKEFYQLSVKPGGYHHHGGVTGFNKKLWKATQIMNDGVPALKLAYLSLNGEEGFPGNLLATVIYTLNDKNELIVDYTAITDKTTLLNLTQHTYFNLAGQASGDIYDHELTLPLNSYLPVNEKQVPNGEITDVTGTPFDFKSPKAIGKQIDDDNEQLNLSNGYDHSWVIKSKNSDELKLAAQVMEPISGRTLTVYTTEPAVHLYAGNFLGDTAGKNGFIYPRRGGFCLETQQYPDSPNIPHFPGSLLRKGDTFKSRTIFEFGVE